MSNEKKFDVLNEEQLDSVQAAGSQLPKVGVSTNMGGNPEGIKTSLNTG